MSCGGKKMEQHSRQRYEDYKSFMRRHQQTVWRICYDFSRGDIPRCEDMVQEVWIMLWLKFDTMTIEDCGSIDNTEADDLKVYTLDSRIVVEGTESETVRIFDITGRSVRNEAIPTGVYLVKVGDRPACKVVVMK